MEWYALSAAWLVESRNVACQKHAMDIAIDQCNAHDVSSVRELSLEFLVDYFEHYKAREMGTEKRGKKYIA